jgi:hypothetical protein
MNTGEKGPQLVTDASSPVTVEERPHIDPRWQLLIGRYHQFFLSVQPPITQALQERLQGVLSAQGGWLAQYLPDNGFLAVGPVSAAELLQDTRGTDTSPRWPAAHPFAQEYYLQGDVLHIGFISVVI